MRTPESFSLHSATRARHSTALRRTSGSCSSAKASNSNRDRPSLAQGRIDQDFVNSYAQRWYCSTVRCSKETRLSQSSSSAHKGHDADPLTNASLKLSTKNRHCCGLTGFTASNREAKYCNRSRYHWRLTCCVATCCSHNDFVAKPASHSMQGNGATGTASLLQSRNCPRDSGATDTYGRWCRAQCPCKFTKAFPRKHVATSSRRIAASQRRRARRSPSARFTGGIKG